MKPEHQVRIAGCLRRHSTLMGMMFDEIKKIKDPEMRLHMLNILSGMLDEVSDIRITIEEHVRES